MAIVLHVLRSDQLQDVLSGQVDPAFMLIIPDAGTRMTVSLFARNNKVKEIE